MEISDTGYLLKQQYRTATNLTARIQLHQRFSTNPVPWYHWMFDRFPLHAPSVVLELGCGAGTLWHENCARIPSTWTITLSDFSPGMIADAQRLLQTCAHPFTFQEINAQDIPFPDATFNIVIANHMLYHVPNRTRALAEVRRVLQQDGVLYAATNGQEHMHEIYSLIHRFDPQANVEPLTGFTLEQGLIELQAFFDHVTIHHYENILCVTEIEPLVAYVASNKWLQPEQRDAFANFIAQELDQHGSIIITTAVGVLEGRGA